MMAQLTIRGVPEDIKRELEHRARAAGLSVNRLVLNMLADRARPTAEEKTRRREAIRRLAGSWTPEEIAHFKERLAEMRRIDEEMWDDEAIAGHVRIHRTH